MSPFSSMSLVHMGASTVKWTTPYPYLVFNESDSKLYINFEYYEEKKSYTFLKHIDLQSQANHDDKNNSKKSSHILDDSPSGVQVGDFEQVIV